jgi:hypothetical protein
MSYKLKRYDIDPNEPYVCIQFKGLCPSWGDGHPNRARCKFKSQKVAGISLCSRVGVFQRIPLLSSEYIVKEGLMEDNI